MTPVFFGKVKKPCGDCADGYCTMNCSGREVVFDPPPLMDARDVVRLLEQEIGNGTAKAWAETNGVSAAYVSDVLRGSRSPGEAILKPLGLRRITCYERIE